MKLAGQVAIVVGGARGIGEAIARLFSKEGANIVLVDLDTAKSQLDSVAQTIDQQGGNAIALIADVTDDAQVNNMANEVVKRYGKIDILVNSAGLRGPLVPVQDITEEEWDIVL
ncbi:MAG TPA: SDR family NAD(P)-dependent oxidoreductase, partial [Candidatus Binatia bacterium]|nr:SDR family NAD(P)-dependent oxidoreductase [Candidatus Binatia bacterium]